MALLSRGQVVNPIALHAILSDFLTEITDLRAQANALVVDVADQRVSIEQGLVDSAASKVEFDKLHTDITAVEAEADAGNHGTTSISASQLAALSQVATETLTGIAATATIIEQQQFEPKSTDPSIK